MISKIQYRMQDRFQPKLAFQAFLQGVRGRTWGQRPRKEPRTRVPHNRTVEQRALIISQVNGRLTLKIYCADQHSS